MIPAKIFQKQLSEEEAERIESEAYRYFDRRVGVKGVAILCKVPNSFAQSLYMKWVKM